MKLTILRYFLTSQLTKKQEIMYSNKIADVEYIFTILEVACIPNPHIQNPFNAAVSWLIEVSENLMIDAFNSFFKR